MPTPTHTSRIDPRALIAGATRPGVRPITRVFRPTGPSGGFDGNQEFITRYGDPFDG
jgi:hypothetical protein